MRKPNESLDDYTVKQAPENLSKPPREVLLKSKGEVEVLKPLIRLEVPIEAARWVAGHQPLWFRRFVAVGSGALMMMAFVLVSAILIEMSESSDVADIAPPEQLEIIPQETREPVNFDLFSSNSSESSDDADVVGSKIKRKPVRLTISRPSVRPRSVPQAVESKFVPTTLVIYAENGVIKRRIEPWLQSS